MNGCNHKTHRVPDVGTDSARIILPECAGREAWLQARTLGIGGSEIGALIGVSEYSTTFDVWRSKMGESKDLSGEAPIEWGHRLEEAVGRKTADEIGLMSRTGGGLWQSREHEYALVTPDRFATRPRSWKVEGLIECKTAGDSEGWADGSGPLGYQAQLQWQMGILGLKKGWLGCLVLGSSRDFYVVELDFDPEWFAEMLHVAETFWSRYVLAGEPPMHDLDHPRTADLLKELHPNVARPSAELPEDAVDWVRAFHEAKVVADEAEKRLDEVKNYFRMSLTDAAAGYIGDVKVASYPEVVTSSIDTKLLQEKFPDIADQVTRKSSHRRLTIPKSALKKLEEADQA